MRQWGSSLNYNGMSVFIANIPEDTALYHGTLSPVKVTGPEWLAFEPEHAQFFARAAFEDLLPPKNHTDAATSTNEDQRTSDSKLSSLSEHNAQKVLGRHAQHESMEEDQDVGPGYLHTYRAKKPLRFLYLDGESAAKSLKGTNDLGDLLVLRNFCPPTEQEDTWFHPTSLRSRRLAEIPPAHLGLKFTKPSCDGRNISIFDDEARANGLCKLASNEWAGRIDGFIRMEGGFEVILCDFDKSLDLVHVTHSGRRRHSAKYLHQFNLAQAVAARYDGIGGGRVILDYDDFVSALSMSDVVYFDDQRRPRVNASNEEGTAAFYSALTDMVMRDHKSQTTNWQETVDMVVSRYSDRLEVLSDPSGFETLGDFTEDVDRALRPFVDYGNRNSTRETELCAAQMLPRSQAHATLAQEAIFNVTTTLCEGLISAYYAPDLPSGFQIIHKLQEWLGWTTWKRCRGCKANEICFLPIWFLGTEEDFRHPTCQDRQGLKLKPDGYWNEIVGNQDL